MSASNPDRLDRPDHPSAGAGVGPRADVAALQERVAELETLCGALRAGPALVALSTLDEGRFLDVNDSFLRFTGYRRDEVIGRTSAEVGLCAHPDQRSEAVRDLLAVGTAHNLETVISDSSGELRAWLWSAELVDIRGQRCLVSVAMDVTDRKRAEQALRESERKYRVLVEEQGLGIGSMDANERFVYANRAGHEIFGVPPGTLIGRSLHEFTDDANFALAQQQTQVRRSGKGSTYEMGICRPSGEVRTIVVTATPEYDAEGRYVSTLGIFRDITAERAAEEERRKLEARMQQAQKLESLGVLAGGIAHDFNNLLAAIVGNASFALTELPPTSPIYECLKEIERSSFRAAELTRQMLAYAGQGRFSLQRVDLGATVAEMGSLLRTSLSKKCQLELQLGSNLPAVEADLAQLRQVIMNLVTNGAEAIGDAPGAVTVATGVTSLDRAQLAACILDATDDRPEALYVYVEVQDTGCGMTPEVRARIFDPFYSTKFTGRGLGLPAVLGIVRSHNGALQVVSSPGHGTTVRAFFPAVPPAAQATAAPSRAASATGAPSCAAPAQARTILLVDDEETVRSMARRILVHAGYAVRVAVNGRQAVELFAAEPEAFDLVLLDLTMPEMDGEEAFAELRRVKADARVILSSGYSEEDATTRFDGKGLDGFLQKPYLKETLLRAVSRVLGAGAGASAGQVARDSSGEP